MADGLALGQEGLGDAVPEVPGGHGGDLSWEGGGVGGREGGGGEGEEKDDSRHRLA